MTQETLIGFVRRILEVGTETGIAKYVIERIDGEEEISVLELPNEMLLQEGQAFRLSGEFEIDQDTGWFPRLSMMQDISPVSISLSDMPIFPKRSLSRKEALLRGDAIEDITFWAEIADTWPQPSNTEAQAELVLYQPQNFEDASEDFQYARDFLAGVAEYPSWLVDTDKIKWKLVPKDDDIELAQTENMRDVERRLAQVLPVSESWSHVVFSAEMTSFAGMHIRSPQSVNGDGLYERGVLVFPSLPYEDFLVEWSNSAGTIQPFFPKRPHVNQELGTKVDRLFTIMHEFGHVVDSGMLKGEEPDGIESADSLRSETFADCFGLLAVANKYPDPTQLIKMIIAPRMIAFLFNPSSHATGTHLINFMSKVVKPLKVEGRLGNLSAHEIIEFAKDFVKQEQPSTLKMRDILAQRDALYKSWGFVPEEDTEGGSFLLPPEEDGFTEYGATAHEGDSWVTNQIALVDKVMEELEKGTIDRPVKQYLSRATSMLKKCCYLGEDLKKESIRKRYVRQLEQDFDSLLERYEYDPSHYDGLAQVVFGDWMLEDEELPPAHELLRADVAKLFRRKYQSDLERNITDPESFKPIDYTKIQVAQVARRPSIILDPLFHIRPEMRLERVIELTRREMQALSSGRFKLAARCAQAAGVMAETCYYDSRVAQQVKAGKRDWERLLHQRCQAPEYYQVRDFINGEVKDEYVDQLTNWLIHASTAQRKAVSLDSRETVKKARGYRMQRRSLTL